MEERYHRILARIKSSTSQSVTIELVGWLESENDVPVTLPIESMPEGFADFDGEYLLVHVNGVKTADQLRFKKIELGPSRSELRNFSDRYEW